MKFTKRDTNIIKGIAILLMFFHHCFMEKERWATVAYEQLASQKVVSYFPISFAPFSEHTIVYLASFMKICVGMFVFLTGYGMAISYAKRKKENKDIGGYLKHRYKNLMINFMFIFIVVQILAIPTARFWDVYGTGLKAIVYFVIDGFGLAKLLSTPMFCLTWWYMSLAIVLIAIFPFIEKLIDRYQWSAVFAIVILPRALGLNTNMDLIRYMLAYMLGIIFYKKNLLVKIKTYLCDGTTAMRILKFMMSALGMLVLIKCRQNAWIGWKYLDFWDGVVPAYVIAICYTYFTSLGIISKIFEFLGKHSMNMFLIHSFYRDVFFHKFIYSFYYAWLDYIVLLIISLLSSIALEWIKEKVFMIGRRLQSS